MLAKKQKKKQNKKKMLSKLEHIGFKDNCEHISTSEIENFKITHEVNLFCNKPLTKVGYTYLQDTLYIYLK